MQRWRCLSVFLALAIGADVLFFSLENVSGAETESTRIYEEVSTPVSEEASSSAPEETVPDMLEGTSLPDSSEAEESSALMPEETSGSSDSALKEAVKDSVQEALEEIIAQHTSSGDPEGESVTSPDFGASSSAVLSNDDGAVLALLQEYINRDNGLNGFEEQVLDRLDVVSVCAVVFVALTFCFFFTIRK